jgi:hypothetical protein
MKHEESRLQSACVEWFRYQYPKHVLFAIPNGGARSAVTGRILKREGVLPGVSDLFLMCPNAKGAHGLFIEMKTQAGKPTVAQLEFALQATLAGYQCVVARSLDEFMAVVNNYLNK